MAIRSFRPIIRIIGVTAAVLLVATACGSGGDDAAAEGTDRATTGQPDAGVGSGTPGERRISISMSEFAFDPDVVEVTAGETVTFVVTNVGGMVHEFELSNDTGIEAHVAGGHSGHHDDTHDDDGHHDDGAAGTTGVQTGDGGQTAVISVDPGDAAELTFTFPSDPTEVTRFVCLIPGHYESGMAGDFSYS